VTAALYGDSLSDYEIINLGNNRPVELMEFIHTLEDLSGEIAIKEMVPPQPGDVVATYADISKAKAKLGFSPKTSLKEGLKDFVRWYLDHSDLMRTVRAFRLSKSG
jgi:UDP-glucuronate 4-epimerase